MYKIKKNKSLHFLIKYFMKESNDEDKSSRLHNKRTLSVAYKANLQNHLQNNESGNKKKWKTWIWIVVNLSMEFVEARV